MYKILRYSFYDLIRSKWCYIYFSFYLILSSVLLFLNNSLAKSIITLMNIIVILTPLIGSIFGAMYYYSSKEFAELLLAQPIKRNTVFLGQYIGLSLSLSASLVVGLAIPFIAYGMLISSEITNFISVIIIGIVLTFIFTAISYYIALSNEDKIKGIGLAILFWLLMAVIYDGFFLICLLALKEYPLENFSLFSVLLNPIDLSRILIILKLDIAALLGYTGAVFQGFFGKKIGMLIIASVLAFWIIIPIIMINIKSKKRDF